jgi:hypothetical protein
LVVCAHQLYARRAPPRAQASAGSCRSSDRVGERPREIMPAWPGRLVIRGPNISLPDGSPVRLRGFNLLYQLDTLYAVPRDDTDAALKRLLPGTNVVRLVMLHWDDRPTEMAGKNSDNDCSEVHHRGDGHTIRERCLEQFDAVLRWTARQGLWAIITARASIAAGEDLPENHGGAGDTFFNDPALRARFIKTWTTIAARYKFFERIAGYELLSEPRVQPNTVPAERVRAVYEEMVTAVQAVDARTPILVGPAPFYSRSNLPDIRMPTKHNIIYNFNFFVPRHYVQRLETGLRYPGRMPCCFVHDKDHAKCCPHAPHGADLSKLPCCAAPLDVDSKTLEDELEDALRFSHDHGVPILMDQWGVQREAVGRADYLRDVLRGATNQPLLFLLTSGGRDRSVARVVGRCSTYLNADRCIGRTGSGGTVRIDRSQSFTRTTSARWLTLTLKP